MYYINKKFVVIIVLLIFLAGGFLFFRSIYNNRIPKSAKLVFVLKE